jgi:2-hydroxychromene-2-carboxylate isomerase
MPALNKSRVTAEKSNLTLTPEIKAPAITLAQRVFNWSLSELVERLLERELIAHGMLKSKFKSTPKIEPPDKLTKFANKIGLSVEDFATRAMEKEIEAYEALLRRRARAASKIEKPRADESGGAKEAGTA